MALQTILRTGEGDEVELVCIVHGRPAPEVVWTRDGHKLPDSIMDSKLHQPRTHTAHDAHMSQNHVAHRHILSIKPVTEKDFGPYVCIAENDHGKESVVIQKTGERERERENYIELHRNSDHTDPRVQDRRSLLNLR